MALTPEEMTERHFLEYHKIDIKKLEGYQTLKHEDWLKFLFILAYACQNSCFICRDYVKENENGTKNIL
jgi:hypothetical protein